MTSAIIADDEPHLADYLCARLAELWPELVIAAVCPNGTAAAAAIDAHDPDLAFLDIRMPGATGLEVARRLQGRPRVVFVTAYDQYAVEAFERNAVDYLLKPVSDERLTQTVERLKSTLAAPPPPSAKLAELLTELAHHMGTPAQKSLRWIRASRRRADGEVTEQIAVADVLYFQADDKYTCVVTREGEALIRVALSELNAQLDSENFAQIHRSVIVNLNFVMGTRRDLAGKLYVRMRDHARELPVARQYAGLFRQM